MHVPSCFKSDPALLEKQPNGGGNHTDTMLAQETPCDLIKSDVAFGLDHGKDRLLIGVEPGTNRLTLLARSYRTRRPPATMQVTCRRYPNANRAAASQWVKPPSMASTTRWRRSIPYARPIKTSLEKMKAQGTRKPLTLIQRSSKML